MRKTIKIFISVIICVSVLLSLVSCNLLDAINDFLNRNQNGPGTTWNDVYQLMWVETYDEMLEIVERTRAHGTEIPQIPAFNCEEYGLDVKFAITVKNNIFNELDDKYEYFDRKINNFSVICCVFFESMTIEEVKCYSHIPRCNCVYLKTETIHKIDSPKGANDVEITRSDSKKEDLVIYYKGKYQLILSAQEYDDFEITEEQIEMLEKTITIIE